LAPSLPQGRRLKRRVLQSRKSPSGPIYDITQILEDPHVIERELLADYPDADMEAFPMHHVVPRLSETPGSIRTPAPRLGEHNRELLAEFNVNYDELLKNKIVVE
jgi:formyl-CoA transferase